MSKFVSSYYPPRARWYSSLFQTANNVRRRVGLEAVHLPAELPLRVLLAGLVVPGLGFYLRGEKRIGKALLGCAAFLALAFIIWLGFPLANLAFGLLLSIHVTSILLLLGPWLAEVRLPFRAVLSLAVLSLLGLGVYGPLRDQLQEHFWMPLRVKGKVVVVQRWSSPRSVQRGQWIAYSLSSHEVASHIHTGEGFGLGPVLAMAGDHLRFRAEGLEVNGVLQAPLRHMPAAGEMVVPEKHWFLWPELVINGHGNVGEANLSAALLQLALVSEEQLVGKPYHWWFWRRQTLL